MALPYQKWSENDDKLRNIFPDGEYVAYIEGITKKLTKSGKFDKNGNPIPQKNMLEVDLLLATDDGKEKKLKDWVLLEGEMSWKFRHLCESCGLLEKYEADMIELTELLRKSVCVLLKTRKMNDQNGIEVTRNVIVDYLKPIKSVSLSKNEFKDDDIPL